MQGIDRALDQHEKTLNYRASRQNVIASNLANADTPGFKAMDLAFPQALKATAPAMATSHGAHFRLSADAAEGAMYQVPAQASIDGNTVNTNKEMASFTDNALRFEAALKATSAEIKRIKSALE